MVFQLFIEAQNKLLDLPSEKEMAKLCAESLASLPGVTACCACLGHAFAHHGDIQPDACEACDWSWQSGKAMAPPPKAMPCKLDTLPGSHVFPIETKDHRFGFFILCFDQAEGGERYTPMIQNLANGVALAMENRAQKNTLQKVKDALEKSQKRHQLLLSSQQTAQQERMAHLLFLERMDRINQVIQGANDLEQVMSDVLDAMLCIFDCDRAWLVYPCDPNAPSWQVPMERTKPKYPGANVLGMAVPMDPGVRQAHTIALAARGPVKYGLGTENPLPAEDSEKFGYKCFMSMAIYPKIGSPWLLGMHQCAYVRQWTAQEERLFQEIGNRLADGLTSLLSYRDLQKSEERYRLVFENSPVALLEADHSGARSLLDDLKQQGVTDIEPYLDQHPEVIQYYTDQIKILDVNRAALTLYRAANKDQMLAELTHTFTPESFDYFRKELVCLWYGQTQIKSDAVVKTFSGDRRMVTISFCVCPGYEQTLSKVNVSIDDITERKVAEQSLHQLNIELDQRVLERTLQLEAANRELEAFADSVSHDLRSPLRYINGFVELLQRKTGTALDEQSRHHVDAISSAARKMERLIDDLLAFSRMGRHDLTVQSVELKPLVDEVIGALAPDTDGRQIDWRIGDLPPVAGDLSMLRMVMVNLIANAVKYTGPRDTAHIEIGAQPGNNAETVIFVRDNGVGFDPAYAHKLFGVFQRLHRADEFEGTGIGLATVRRIINKHGGRTWAEGEHENGATFYFSLPDANGRFKSQKSGSSGG